MRRQKRLCCRNVCRNDHSGEIKGAPKEPEWHAAMDGTRRDAILCGTDALTRFPTPGQRSQDSPHLLQGQDLQEAHPAQSHPVQGRQSLVIRPRKASIRPQAVRLRWSDEACVPQEGKDNQEGRVEIGVHIMQDEGTIIAQALQAFRAGR